ncbi:DUF998 domain-containing protein [Uliginosibacterium gangwonense]|uniref:DUF998 domain-containing protein n=1 Tax=Uliginosibacterium gangwonense TaxID=392736 RepID=UPI00038141AD|nr:DUF998 domain-containing protein [Uliginosibacterium gangwonense]
MFHYQSKLYPALSIACALGFVLIVAWLQHIQPGYNPYHQLMSELYFGHQGETMHIAFCLLALSVAALGVALAGQHVWQMLLGPIFIASLCFLAIGAIQIDWAKSTHLTLIGVALICSLMSMVLLPHSLSRPILRYPRTISWSAGALMLASSVQGILPTGLGIRLTVGALLIWVCCISIQLLLRKPEA